ncbi:TPM domain-containing protein [Rothia kristinae]|nr:TPM domain-containing protein [Rothia kristinae]
MVTLIARPARAARLPVRWAALAAVVLLLLLTACGSSSGSGGEAERGVPARPESGAVLDEAGILDEDGMAQVNRVIADRNRESDAARVAVITVNRAPQDWERWTREVAGTWGVGDAGADNGVLLAIDMGERRTRLEVADGVRQRLDDDAAAAILDEVTEPALKDDEYVRGVRETVEAVYDQAEGRTPAAVAEGREGHRLGVIVATVILSLVASPCSASWGGSGGRCGAGGGSRTGRSTGTWPSTPDRRSPRRSAGTTGSTASTTGRCRPGRRRSTGVASRPGGRAGSRRASTTPPSTPTTPRPSDPGCPCTWRPRACTRAPGPLRRPPVGTGPPGPPDPRPPSAAAPDSPAAGPRAASERSRRRGRPVSGRGPASAPRGLRPGRATSSTSRRTAAPAGTRPPSAGCRSSGTGGW